MTPASTTAIWSSASSSTDPVQAGQVEHDRAAPRDRTTSHSGSGATRHDRHAVSRGKPHRRPDVGDVTGAYHDLGQPVRPQARAVHSRPQPGRSLRNWRAGSLRGAPQRSQEEGSRADLAHDDGQFSIAGSNSKLETLQEEHDRGRHRTVRDVVEDVVATTLDDVLLHTGSTDPGTQRIPDRRDLVIATVQHQDRLRRSGQRPVSQGKPAPAHRSRRSRRR